MLCGVCRGRIQLLSLLLSSHLPRVRSVLAKDMIVRWRQKIRKTILRAIIEWRRACVNVVELELDTWWTSVSEWRRRDATLLQQWLMRTLLMVWLLITLHRGCRSTTSVPCQLRKVGKRRYTMSQMAVNFVGAGACRVNDHWK